MEKLTYCFVSPFPTGKTTTAIYNAFQKVGEVIEADTSRGYIRAKFRVSALRKIKMEFFVQRSQTECKVRMVMPMDFAETQYNIRWVDGLWDKFLIALMETEPDADFGVTMAFDNAVIVGVQYLGSDIIQTQNSVTSGGSSLLGFLAGGALFGSAGAIVGGMSGSQHTTGESFDMLSNKQIAKVIYNNGRYWEGVVKKGSRMYNEIMVNL